MFRSIICCHRNDCSVPSFSAAPTSHRVVFTLPHRTLSTPLPHTQRQHKSSSRLSLKSNSFLLPMRTSPTAPWPPGLRCKTPNITQTGGPGNAQFMVAPPLTAPSLPAPIVGIDIGSRVVRAAYVEHAPKVWQDFCRRYYFFAFHTSEMSSNTPLLENPFLESSSSQSSSCSSPTVPVVVTAQCRVPQRSSSAVSSSPCPPSFCPSVSNSAASLSQSSSPADEFNRGESSLLEKNQHLNGDVEAVFFTQAVSSIMAICEQKRREECERQWCRFLADLRGRNDRAKLSVNQRNHRYRHRTAKIIYSSSQEKEEADEEKHFRSRGGSKNTASFVDSGRLNGTERQLPRLPLAPPPLAKLSQVIFAVPQHNTNQHTLRQALMAAADRAGYRCVRLLPAPIAVCIAYRSPRYHQNSSSRRSTRRQPDGTLLPLLCGQQGEGLLSLCAERNGKQEPVGVNRKGEEEQGGVQRCWPLPAGLTAPVTQLGLHATRLQRRASVKRISSVSDRASKKAGQKTNEMTVTRNQRYSHHRPTEDHEEDYVAVVDVGAGGTRCSVVSIDKDTGVMGIVSSTAFSHPPPSSFAQGKKILQRTSGGRRRCGSENSQEDEEEERKDRCSHSIDHLLREYVTRRVDILFRSSAVGISPENDVATRSASISIHVSKKALESARCTLLNRSSAIVSGRVVIRRGPWRPVGGVGGQAKGCTEVEKENKQIHYQNGGKVEKEGQNDVQEEGKEELTDDDCVKHSSNDDLLNYNSFCVTISPVTFDRVVGIRNAREALILLQRAVQQMHLGRGETENCGGLFDEQAAAADLSGVQRAGVVKKRTVVSQELKRTQRKQTSDDIAEAEQELLLHCHSLRQSHNSQCRSPPMITAVVLTGGAAVGLPPLHQELKRFMMSQQDNDVYYNLKKGNGHIKNNNVNQKRSKFSLSQKVVYQHHAVHHRSTTTAPEVSNTWKSQGTTTQRPRTGSPSSQSPSPPPPRRLIPIAFRSSKRRRRPKATGGTCSPSRSEVDSSRSVLNSHNFHAQVIPHHLFYSKNNKNDQHSKKKNHVLPWQQEHRQVLIPRSRSPSCSHSGVPPAAASSSYSTAQQHNKGTHEMDLHLWRDKFITRQHYGIGLPGVVDSSVSHENDDSPPPLFFFADGGVRHQYSAAAGGSGETKNLEYPYPYSSSQYFGKKQTPVFDGWGKLWQHPPALPVPSATTSLFFSTPPPKYNPLLRPIPRSSLKRKKRPKKVREKIAQKKEAQARRTRKQDNQADGSSQQTAEAGEEKASYSMVDGDDAAAVCAAKKNFVSFISYDEIGTARHCVSPTDFDPADAAAVGAALARYYH